MCLTVFKSQWKTRVKNLNVFENLVQFCNEGVKDGREWDVGEEESESDLEGRSGEERDSQTTGKKRECTNQLMGEESQMGWDGR
eukprot:2101472-Rhodomonas_salina.2